GEGSVPHDGNHAADLRSRRTIARRDADPSQARGCPSHDARRARRRQARALDDDAHPRASRDATPSRARYPLRRGVLETSTGTESELVAYGHVGPVLLDGPASGRSERTGPTDISVRRRLLHASDLPRRLEPPLYSDLKASCGSILVARRAGTYA